MLDFEGDARRVDDPATLDTGKGSAPIVDIGADEFVPVSACIGDFLGDGDVDGSDLVLWAAGANITLEDFATDFGRNDCL